MKTLLTILLFLSLNARATIYYFSFTDGDDSRSAATAQNSATPWKTINKLNSEWAAGTFAPGDQILFKRGDTWLPSGNTYPITPAENGTALNRIIIGAYGSGALPKFSGFTTITAWTNVSGNVWESTSAITSDATLKLNMVVVDGLAQHMGREPDITDANKGYINATSIQSSTQFTATGFTNTPNNWTGARAILRTGRAAFDSITITAHTSGGQITVSRPAVYGALGTGEGFFISNDVRTLDQHGEWYYNPTTRKLSIYTTLNPNSNYTIQAATVNTLMTLTGDQYITFEDVRFEGANEVMINITDASGSATPTKNIIFDDFEMYYAGRTFVQTSTSVQTDFTFTDGYLSDALNYGLDLRSAGSNKTVQRCTINRVAMFAGMMTNVGVGSSAILSNSGSNHNFSYNTIKNQGYNAIRSNGASNQRICGNFIDSFCITMDDGGAIYTVETSATVRSGIVIDSNIVIHGIGAGEGVTSSNNSHSAGGIYLDDHANHVEMLFNTVGHIKGKGIWLHHANNVDIRYNTVYDCSSYAIFFQKNVSTSSSQLYNLTIKHNKFIAKERVSDNSQYIFGYSNYDLNNTTAGTINGMGTIDSNYYARPTVDSTNTSQNKYIRILMETGTSDVLAATNYNLIDWRALTNHDDNTKQSPLQFAGANLDTLSQFFYNETSTSATESISDQYMDMEGNIYNPPTVSVPAYGSRFLLKTPTSPATEQPAGVPVIRGNKVIYRGNKKIVR
jgi:hypothetical protein